VDGGVRKPIGFRAPAVRMDPLVSVTTLSLGENGGFTRFETLSAASDSGFRSPDDRAARRPVPSGAGRRSKRLEVT